MLIKDEQKILIQNYIFEVIKKWNLDLHKKMWVINHVNYFLNKNYTLSDALENLIKYFDSKKYLINLKFFIIFFQKEIIKYKIKEKIII